MTAPAKTLVQIFSRNTNDTDNLFGSDDEPLLLSDSEPKEPQVEVRGDEQDDSEEEREREEVVEGEQAEASED
jgi:hypothetical protein